MNIEDFAKERAKEEFKATEKVSQDLQSARKENFFNEYREAIVTISVLAALSGIGIVAWIFSVFYLFAIPVSMVALFGVLRIYNAVTQQTKKVIELSNLIKKSSHATDKVLRDISGDLKSLNSVWTSILNRLKSK